MTLALVLGAVRLAKQQVLLLNSMKGIETLSRVDVLCVDKTGLSQKIKWLFASCFQQIRKSLH